MLKCKDAFPKSCELNGTIYVWNMYGVGGDECWWRRKRSGWWRMRLWWWWWWWWWWCSCWRRRRVRWMCREAWMVGLQLAASADCSLCRTCTSCSSCCWLLPGGETIPTCPGAPQPPASDQPSGFNQPAKQKDCPQMTNL